MVPCAHDSRVLELPKTTKPLRFSQPISTATQNREFFTAVIHHGLWSGETTSHFPCLSSPSLEGEIGKSTLIFLDCFAVSDSFNTAKNFCLASKQLLGINVKVLKDLGPFPKAWAFLAFVPTSLKFLQAKFYKLCPLPDIVQQGGC